MNDENLNNITENSVIIDSPSKIFSLEADAYSQLGNSSSPDYVLLSLKKWKLISLITLLGLGISYLFASTLPEVYESSTLVKLGSYSPPGEGPIGKHIRAETQKRDYLLSQAALIKSSGIAMEVLENNNLIYDDFKSKVESLDDEKKMVSPIIKSYLSSISYEMVSGTSLIKITGTSKDPYLAESIANDHSQAFINSIQTNLSKLAKTNLSYLKQRAKEVEKSYFDAEGKALKYAKDNALAGSDIKQIRRTLVERYDTLFNKLSEATLSRARSEAKYKELRNTYSNNVSFDPVISEEFNRLSKIDAEMKVLKNSGRKGFSEYLDVLKAERTTLYSAIRNFNKRKSESSRIEYKAANKAENLLRTEIKNTTREERELYSKMIEFNSLKEKADNLKQRLKDVDNRLEDAVLNSKSNQHIVQLVDKAIFPTNPNSNKKTLLMALGTIASLVFSIFLTIALDSVDQTIGSIEDMQKNLNVPVLGMVPRFGDGFSYGYGYGEEPSDIRKTLSSFSDSFTNIVTLNNESEQERDFSDPDATKSHLRDALNYQQEIKVKESVIAFSKQWSRLSEAFREIFVTIQSVRKDKTTSILISSGDKSDGKSTVAANLAVTYANSGKKTIIIDADFRLPSMNNFFDYSENLVGLSDCLLGHIGTYDMVYVTEVPNLSIAPVGTFVGAYSQLGTGAKLKEVIELLSDQYDMIIIDGPPILHVADSLAMARIVDGVALVVRNGKTLKETAKWTVGRLEQVGGNVLGMIYNDVPRLHNFSRYSY